MLSLVERLRVDVADLFERLDVLSVLGDVDARRVRRFRGIGGLQFGVEVFRVHVTHFTELLDVFCVVRHGKAGRSTVSELLFFLRHH